MIASSNAHVCVVEFVRLLFASFCLYRMLAWWVERTLPWYSPSGPNRKLVLIDMNPKMLRWPFGVSDDQMGKPPWLELRTVYVSKNLLKGLPHDFFKLTNLTDLRLDNNLMTNLAVTVSQLTNLHTLWLHNNLLETLPVEVSVLQELRYDGLFLPFRNFLCQSS
jgi:hypothetical protein